MAKILDRWHVPGGTIAIWSDYPGAYWAKRKRPYESWLLFGRDFEAAKAWLATPPDRDEERGSGEYHNAQRH